MICGLTLFGAGSLWSPRLFASSAPGFAFFLKDRSPRHLPRIFGRRHACCGNSMPDKSIAVLPFENRSRDPDNAYFADSIQDEILTRLAKIADLKVISRTSTQHYKSRTH